MNTLNVAFIGCGAIARKHAEVLRGIGGVRLKTVWNRTPDRAAALAAEFGAAAVADWRIIFDDPAIAAVYINTMHNDRRPYVEAAAASGKAIFCEKPLTHTLADLRALRAIVADSGILFQAGYKTRFHSAMVEARARLAEPEVIHAQVFDETWPEGGLNRADVGGGNLVSQGVYGTEAAYLLARARPVSVSAAFRNQRHPDHTPVPLCAVYTFAQGAMATVTAAVAGRAPDPVGKFFVSAAGGNGCLTLLDRYRRLSWQDGAGRVGGELAFAEDGFARQSEQFLAAVAAGGSSPVPFDEGAIPSLMIWKALESAELGRRVSIDPEVDLALLVP